jgi:predicted HTH transcriptional regulator
MYGKEDRLRAKEKKRAQVEQMLAGIMTYATDKRNALVSAGVVSTGYEGAEDGDTLDAVLGISNDEVEAKLGVSDTTAAKYLKELVTRGLLEKRGKGRGVVYRVTEN